MRSADNSFRFASWCCERILAPSNKNGVKHPTETFQKDIQHTGGSVPRFGFAAAEVEDIGLLPMSIPCQSDTVRKKGLDSFGVVATPGPSCYVNLTRMLPGQTLGRGRIEPVHRAKHRRSLFTCVLHARVGSNACNACDISHRNERPCCRQIEAILRQINVKSQVIVRWRTAMSRVRLLQVRKPWPRVKVL